MQLPRGGDGCYTKIHSAYGKWAMYPFTLARYAVRRSSPTLKNHPRGLGTMGAQWCKLWGRHCSLPIHTPHTYRNQATKPRSSKCLSPLPPSPQPPPSPPQRKEKCNHPIPIWTHEANLGTRHVDGPVEVILGHQPTCRSRAPPTSTSTSIPPPHPAISPAPGARTHSPLGCGCGMIADNECIPHSPTHLLPHFLTHSLTHSFIHSCTSEKPSSRTTMHRKLQQ